MNPQIDPRMIAQLIAQQGAQPQTPPQGPQSPVEAEAMGQMDPQTDQAVPETDEDGNVCSACEYYIPPTGKAARGACHKVRDGGEKDDEPGYLTSSDASAILWVAPDWTCGSFEPAEETALGEHSEEAEGEVEPVLTRAVKAALVKKGMGTAMEALGGENVGVQGRTKK